MNDQILSTLNKIANALKEQQLPISIMGGSSGCYLFNFLYLNYLQEKQIDINFQKEIQELAEHSISTSYSNFSNGQAGVNWFFSYLYKYNFLEKADWEFLCSNDTELKNIALQYLNNDYYDFLHGGTGIAYYLLYINKFKSDIFFSNFFSGLNLLMAKGDSIIPHYDLDAQKLDLSKVNIGISHGLVSILKFSMQCYKQNICTSKAKKLAKSIIEYLKLNTNLDKTISYYPSIIEKGKNNNSVSRLAWCYGDLSIGLILYQSSLLFEDEHLKNYSLDILKHTTKRRIKQHTTVVDAGICHGSAGIAHIYNKMWHYTNDKVFKNATDFWILETLNFSLHKDGIAGYKKYNLTNDKYENDFGLLQGSAGIGLVLLSYITGDFSWDYCLMLND